MGRTILPGARVRISARARPAAGTVWAYCDPDGRVMVHRCLGRRGRDFVFQGDGRPVPDPPVPGDVLVGAVVAVDDGGTVRPLGTGDRIWRGFPRCLRFRISTVAGVARRRWRRVAGRRRDS